MPPDQGPQQIQAFFDQLGNLIMLCLAGSHRNDTSPQETRIQYDTMLWMQLQFADLDGQRGSLASDHVHVPVQYEAMHYTWHGNQTKSLIPTCLDMMRVPLETALLPSRASPR